MENYGTDEVGQTPYQRARQVIDERVGTAKQQAYLWRVFALGMVVVTLVAVGGLIYQSSKASIEPYIVEVGQEGHVRLVGTPSAEQWHPSQGVKRHFLEEWLLDVRELSSDRDVVRQNLLDAYNAVSARAKVQLDTLVHDMKPFEKIGKESRQLSIESINKLSADSWRIEWREDVFDKGGSIERRETYVGIIELVEHRPTDRQALEKNPLGLYVSHFSINQRTSAAAPKPSADERDE